MSARNASIWSDRFEPRSRILRYFNSRVNWSKSDAIRRRSRRAHAINQKKINRCKIATPAITGVDSPDNRLSKSVDISDVNCGINGSRMADNNKIGLTDAPQRPFNRRMTPSVERNHTPVMQTDSIHELDRNEIGEPESVMPGPIFVRASLVFRLSLP